MYKSRWGSVYRTVASQPYSPQKGSGVGADIRYIIRGLRHTKVDVDTSYLLYLTGIGYPTVVEENDAPKWLEKHRRYFAQSASNQRLLCSH
jgi:hypothetical protein